MNNNLTIIAVIVTLLFILKESIVKTFSLMVNALALPATVTIWAILIFGIVFVLLWLSGRIDEAWHNHKVKRSERQRLEREANSEITIAAPGSLVFRHTTRGYSLVSEPLHLLPEKVNGHPSAFNQDAVQRWYFNTLANAQHRGSARGMTIDHPMIEPLLQPVIELIKGEPCVAFWGGRGSGKTTHALHWLAHRRSENYVIDPKPLGLNPWPNARVIGGSGQFDEIEPSIERIYNELLHRQSEGLLNESPITLLVDELYTLVHVHKLEIMKMVFAITTLGREYEVHASFTTSAKGVKSLQIEGMSGLADALTFVQLQKVGNEFKAFVDMGNGEIECLPCGPYIPNTTRQIPSSIAMTDEERVLELHHKGMSKTAIAREVFGEGIKAQMPDIDRVVEILGAYGLKPNRVKKVGE